MPRRKTKTQPIADKPFRVIDGALSIYRAGDVVKFRYGNIQFEGVVTGSKIEEIEGIGELWLDLSANVRVNAAFVKRAA